MKYEFDFEKAREEFKKEKAKEKASALEDARLREMFDAALEQSPEYHARNQELAEKTGLPMEVITGWDGELERRMKIQQMEEVLLDAGPEAQAFVAYEGKKPEQDWRGQYPVSKSDIMGVIVGGLLLIAFGVALITALCVTFRQIKKEWASRRIRQGVFVAIVWVASSPFALFYWGSGFDVAAALVFVPPFVAGVLLCLYRRIVG